MNNQRRKELRECIDELKHMAACRDDLVERIETLMGEEQEAIENMPESLQEGDRSQMMQAAIDEMDSAMDSLNEMDFQEAIEHLKSAGE